MHFAVSSSIYTVTVCTTQITTPEALHIQVV